ncbi:Proteasome maturation protein [Entamoeba marina]
MESTLTYNEMHDVRHVIEANVETQPTNDYHNLVQSLNDNARLNAEFLPLQFGPSFKERLQLEEAVFSYPNRLPQLETASLAKDIVMGTDEDITFADNFQNTSYVLPTFSIHEQVEKSYFD